MIFKHLTQSFHSKLSNNIIKVLKSSLLLFSLPLLTFNFNQTAQASNSQPKIYIGIDENKFGKFKEYHEPYYRDNRNLSPIVKHYNLANRKDVQQLIYICQLQDILENNSTGRGEYTYDDLVRNAKKAEKLLKNKVDTDVFEAVLTNYRKEFDTYRVVGSEDTSVIDKFTDFYPIVFDLKLSKPAKVKGRVDESGGEFIFYITENISSKKYLYFEIPPKKFNEENAYFDATNYKKYKPADTISTVKDGFFTCGDRSSYDYTKSSYY